MKALGYTCKCKVILLQSGPNGLVTKIKRFCITDQRVREAGVILKVSLLLWLYAFSLAHSQASPVFNTQSSATKHAVKFTTSHPFRNLANIPVINPLSTEFIISLKFSRKLTDF